MKLELKLDISNAISNATKAQIALIVILFFAVIAGAWTYTDPNSPVFNYTLGFRMGNTSVNATDIITDNASAKNIGGVIYADQYATIQDAINASHSIGGGIVKVPVGIYLIDNITMYSNIVLEGDGYNVSELRSNAVSWSDNGFIHIGSADAANNQENFIIRGLYINANQKHAIAVHIESGGNYTIEDNKINGFLKNTSSQGSGIVFSAYTPVRNIRIVNNDIYGGNSVSGEDGIVATTQTILDYIIESNHIYNIQGNGIRIDDRPSGGQISKNIIIDPTIGIRFIGEIGTISNTDIYNNHIISSSGNGIEGSSVNRIDLLNINDNVITDSGDKGIYFDIINITNSSIKHNTIINAAVRGIHITSSNYALSVERNKIFGSPYGLSGSADYIIATNNIFTDQSTAPIDTSTFGKNTILMQNYNASPYFHGNSATAPTAFGGGDTYYNTTKNSQCVYTTSWVFIGNSTGTC